MVNEGVTSHFNTISVSSRGLAARQGGEGLPTPPCFSCSNPKLTPAWETWVVTSNKQLTANIGPGANVVLSNN
jgi:hypothetical protein